MIQVGGGGHNTLGNILSTFEEGEGCSVHQGFQRKLKRLFSNYLARHINHDILDLLMIQTLSPQMYSRYPPHGSIMISF